MGSRHFVGREYLGMMPVVRGDEGIEPYTLEQVAFAFLDQKGRKMGRRTEYIRANISVERGGYNCNCWYAHVTFDRTSVVRSWEVKAPEELPEKMVITLNGPGKNKMLRKLQERIDLFNVQRDIKQLPKPLTFGKLRKQAQRRAMRERGGNYYGRPYW